MQTFVLFFTKKECDKLLKSDTAKNAPLPKVLCDRFYDEIANKDDVTKMQYLDINMWLMGDILLKADKTSMANSLELRVPFLDKKVLELAMTLPLDCRVNTETTKLALRHAAEKTLPRVTAQKDKLGFPVPIREWLRQDEYYNIVKEQFTSEAAEQFFDTAKLEKLLEKTVDFVNERELAFYFKDKVLTCMKELRVYADEAENLTSERYWPFPSYGQLLFSVK